MQIFKIIDYEFKVCFWKRDTSNRFETSYIYVFWFTDWKYDRENWRKWHLQGWNSKKKRYFSRFSYYLDKYWFERETFQTKVVVCKNRARIHPVNGLITEYYSSRKCSICVAAVVARRLQAYKSCSLALRIIRFRHPLMRVLLWLLLGFGFWLFLRSDWNLPGSRILSLFEFWARSWLGFVCIFWIRFVVFAERAKRAEPTPKLLCLYESWVCS